MQKKTGWKFAIIFLLLILSVVFLLPNTPVYKHMPSSYKESMPDRGLTLGLDLQGGIHLVFEVKGERAVEITYERLAANIKKKLENKEIDTEVKSEKKSITISKNSDDIKKLLADEYSILELKNSGEKLTYSISDKEERNIKETATDQALETIRNRIDQFGVSEPVIQRQGDSEIVIQLPGVKNPKRAIELIGKTAQLEFKILDEESSVAAELPNIIKSGEEQELMEKFSAKIPEDAQILFQRDTRVDTEEELKRVFLVKKETMLTGELLDQARVTIDSRYNEPYVSITFNTEGAKLFEEITDKYVKRRMAIILDQNIYSAPTIQEKIAGGSAQITGTFTMDEARDLAIVLRAGALPAPIEMLQNLTVGPSLGRDSIEAGKVAGTLSILLVIVFMLIYYKMSGIIADLALFLNVIFLLGAMAMLKATLTLPGIAGIILAVGMAVDTNVLMFERMREELRLGKTPRSAVDSGYDKAFITIVDSHVTTLITAAVLFQYGTGPIKGFAVTLSLGVLINLFTALVGTKSVFDLINSRKEVKRLSI